MVFLTTLRRALNDLLNVCSRLWLDIYYLIEKIPDVWPVSVAKTALIKANDALWDNLTDFIALIGTFVYDLNNLVDEYLDWDKIFEKVKEKFDITWLPSALLNWVGEVATTLNNLIADVTKLTDSLTWWDTFRTWIEARVEDYAEWFYRQGYKVLNWLWERPV